MKTAAPMTLAQARRVAIAAQGLAKGKSATPIGSRGLAKIFEQMQLVQIDSVNVLSRSHYLPFFARLGGYDRGLLDKLSSKHPRKMVEYWAHEASFIQPKHFADVRPWQRRNWFGNNSLAEAEEAVLLRQVMAVLESGRAMTARQVTQRIGHDVKADRDQWGWNWNPVKQVLEKLFIAGEVSVAGRNEQFERRYTPTGRILGAWQDIPADREVSMDRLIDASARAHGLGTVRCFADYFRLPLKPAAEAVQRLAEAGVLEPVTVDGWQAPLFLHQEASRPRLSRARALLSPFDPLVFERRRLLELFGMHYRIGIYTPAHKRTHGYYVLPFLLRDRIVARVDLKADRAGSRLLVQAAFTEPEAPADSAAELAQELGQMAQWLGLGSVQVVPVGDLAAKLSTEVMQLN